ncbi:2-succinyl-6-hydroxy-2,4-cyclohexadiene-1-carboxylate synthase [Erwiniaceae bacterium BAC15a-03b]|uniref:2-succinyl-6-hydroxy-2,4-cyclohexadiene-1-carboxylate synthase n=1 Tax=Winslowiella arboricola TaxID=2978220 RepID=A0A9J6PSN5_9GAMM|nr:2-succinyl-6-hydroxy-2,4-cyclohexadiene-1-carboxylate synthase [Winslowiella arboricola]MCU5771314.1 2-succinyl-6-hydroxy-2,4-cyclohexadiene-1-carboxylate synthase [Winslowiella arboricola]MCU5777055.1 2-succinyl-6-hydroxy-2,4-cyclohexadiene-1-carboxylate synthase [Winslowiella arboricola]
MLHARWQGHHRSSKPVLVWLHGFLGSAADWQEIQHAFSDWPLLSIDLPGHGGSGAQSVSGFDDLCQRLSATLLAHQVERYWLIGYSLGGRTAMYYACQAALPGLMGLIIEAAHPGITQAEERAVRQQSDRCWAARFAAQPLRQTLAQWYAQPLFAELSALQRQQLINARADSYAPALAAMLEATSLSQQPDLLPQLRQLTLPFHYLCGEWDHKFQLLAQHKALPLSTIAAAGHNSHRANPAAFSWQIARILRNKHDLS